VFREVKRVLRDDGTLWLNLGDSYAGGGGSSGHTSETENCGRKTEAYGAVATGGRVPSGLKPKDLVGIPWMVAFALRADGWFLRQDIVWEKPNPMPESVTDRCTKAHEYIFLLTKTGRYYYDAEAIKEDSVDPESHKGRRKRNADRFVGQAFSETRSGFSRLDGQMYPKRNRRSVWTVTTKPYSEAHFATFPPDLILPCILAGTSEFGCCPECGKPWIRVVEKTKTFESGSGRSGNQITGKQDLSASETNSTPDIRMGPSIETKTLGWRPGCECGEDPVPCVVLDPFNGSGTTGEVSVEHGRKYVGIDLNPEYIEMSKKRIRPVVKKKQMLAFVLDQAETPRFGFQEEETDDDETY
jgi:DNA modification methylase